MRPFKEITRDQVRLERIERLLYLWAGLAFTLSAVAFDSRSSLKAILACAMWAWLISFWTRLQAEQESLRRERLEYLKMANKSRLSLDKPPLK
mgnify:CR=1 FL=1